MMLDRPRLLELARSLKRARAYVDLVGYAIDAMRELVDGELENTEGRTEDASRRPSTGDASSRRAAPGDGRAGERVRLPPGVMLGSFKGCACAECARAARARAKAAN